MAQQWMTTADAAQKWGVTERRVNELCRTGRIDGASKLGGRWIIPADALKPADARRAEAASGMRQHREILAAFRRTAGQPADPSDRLPLPVGVSDYRRLVSTYYFVDKTLFIRDLIDARAYVTLFTRPRRFGKTLNMNMLRTFFEKTGEDTSAYFQGSALWACGEKYRAYQGTFPVIALSLKDVKADTYEGARRAIGLLVQREFDRHGELAASSALSDVERQAYEQIRTGAGMSDEASLRESLLLLSALLDKHHRQPVVIIIDEYDTPIEQGHVHGYYDQITAFMRVFFSAAFKDNEHLHLGVMTGILRVAKEGIFSGLNNVQVFSVLDEPYASYFGFTAPEVRAMAVYYGVPDAYEEICAWYDGYRFGAAEVFNPWSVISYFANGCKAQAYWVSTANNQVLGEILHHADASVIAQLRALVEGKTVAATVNISVVYPRLGADASTIFSFLLMSGYLKPAGEVPGAPGTYLLSIPNKEVAQAFTGEILSELSDAPVSAPVTDIQVALVTGDVAAFQGGLWQFLLSSASYYDTANESFYHGLMLGLCALLGNRYRIESNREAGEGRFDIRLEPRQAGLPAVVMELKAAKEMGEKDLEALAAAALEQIRERSYRAGLSADVPGGAPAVLAYGVAFGGKRLAVVMERIDGTDQLPH